MKVSILLACGALGALTSAAASGQARPPPGSDLHLNTRAAMSAPQAIARTRDATPPAPRGDLRGDIASNVRARPDSERESQGRHH
ncbi:hypothetical protein [Caballeronia sp. GAWG1-1]|uniref:hypothetical protein n=1 Tax=Caballeronia sp. GAWG1-1 TaxID=2921742 RepID=UPI002029398F|nr:hypothetical protein [Caballeronia sp. GAWG1-1]